MNRDDKRKFVVATIILSILVLALSSYLIYDKVLAKDDSEEIINEDTNKDDNNVVENNGSKEENNVIETVKVPTELEKYKNISGSYGYIKNFRSNVASGDFNIKLSLDGKIFINKSGEKEQILKIDNVVDLELLGADGYLFILTINGDIYRYDLFNYDQKNYEPKKLEEYSNVDKFLSLSYCPDENACFLILL